MRSDIIGQKECLKGWQAQQAVDETMAAQNSHSSFLDLHLKGNGEQHGVTKFCWMSDHFNLSDKTRSAHHSRLTLNRDFVIGQAKDTPSNHKISLLKSLADIMQDLDLPQTDEYMSMRSSTSRISSTVRTSSIFTTSKVLNSFAKSEERYEPNASRAAQCLLTFLPSCPSSNIDLA